MSAQRAEVHWARYLDGNRRVVLEADHARIVAEATAEARAAERRHWESRFRNAEQAHAAALAEGTRIHGAQLLDAYAKGIAASKPRTLTADDVLAAVNAIDYDAVLAATPAPKTARAQVYTLHALARDAILTLIHDGEATPQASTWGMRPDESPGEWLARVESPESKAAWEKFCDGYEASKRRANRGAAIDGEATR